MKLATYHKLKGDDVEFVFGMDRYKRDDFWDVIYITSVFTYDIDTLVKTVRYYRGNPANSNVVRVGGISASLMANHILDETGVLPHFGLLDKPDPFLHNYAKTHREFSYLNECAPSIDNLPPDYGIFGKYAPQYSKILDNAYYFFSTKGCLTGCDFCAVMKLEPTFVHYIPIFPRIQFIRDNWGEKDNLLLLDNNVAASDNYDKIIDEIKDCGFERGARLKKINNNGRIIYKNRTVDFNQGIDARRMNKKKMIKMAQIAISPLRLAFDNISLRTIYEEKARLALDCGILSLSNYMLFNFKDSPADLYNRFMVNIEILRDYPNAKIFSFPMRYSPIDRTDRKYLGPNWTRRELRNLQLIMHATHGIVSHKEKFFMRAFGDSVDQFKRLLLYPYNYIINRNHYEYETYDIQKWESKYSSLTECEKAEFRSLIVDGKLITIPVTNNKNINELLTHYEGEHTSVFSKNE
jgi:hypothetical protein